MRLDPLARTAAPSVVASLQTPDATPACRRAVGAVGAVALMLAVASWAPAKAAEVEFGTAAAAGAPSAEADAAFYERAAQCSAVMKSQVLALTDRYKDGETGVRPEIERLTRLTFTMVGKAYLRGLRGEAADRLLEAAETAQARWPAARQQALAKRCETEAARLYDEANFLERMLVHNRAQARVARLLDESR